MRPLKLTISAFAAYKNETVIDFSKLGKDGLYLISGDTGAGKTTIFDGICYALYGEASGDTRKADMLRSKYADPSTPTFAELEFECRNKVYTVRRSPEYERPKARGEGTTRSAAAAELIHNGQVLAAKTNDVTRRIEEIIGVDRDRFTQIAMIAQGDFLKLLMARTDERILVFRKLFNTENYNRLQERIKEDHAEVSRNYKALRDRVTAFMPADEHLSDEALTEHYRNKLKEALEQEKLLSENEAALISQTEKLAADMARAEEINRKHLRLKTNSEEISRTLDLKAAAENAFKTALENKLQIEAQRKRSAEIKALLPRYDELSAKLKKKQEISSDILRTESAVRDCTNTLESIKVQLEKDTAQRETLKDCAASAEKAKAEVNEHSTGITALNEFSDKLRLCRKAASDYEEAQKEFLSANRLYNEVNDLCTMKENAYLNGQAGILASELKDGEPCKVCGSLTHPSPAQKCSDIPTESELNELKKHKNTLDADRNKKSEAAHSLSGQLETYRNTADDLCIKYFGASYGDDSSEKLRSLLKEKETLLTEARQHVSEMEKGAIRFTELDRIISENQESSAAALLKLKENEKLLAEKQTELKACTEAAEALSAQLEFADRAQADEYAAKLDRSCEELEKSISDAENKVHQTEKQLAVLDGEKALLEQQLSGTTQLDITALKEQKAQLDSEKAGLDSKKKHYAVEIARYDNALKEIAQLFTDSEKLYRKLMQLGALNDAANGKKGENGKIMLETRVQAIFFDRILHKANIRFSHMTGGQYILVRCKEAADRRSQTGLELNVIDRCNGSERSVRTLSGGESFKASLSLALGLSDVVTEAAGGVRLDSMFIDEGFGSLDTDSLSQALDALNDLGGSGRLVGIISHVDGLKHRIERQIRISKTFSGHSKAEIINI